jgi:hypothetical protein
MPEIIRFACLTGLRPSEACESVKLLPQQEANYYNPERQALEHFRFAHIFLRPTKKAYLSYLSIDDYLYFTKIAPKTLL